MKVCFLNRNPTTHAGGDLIMLEQLMSALLKLGAECTNLYGDWQPESLHHFDLIHIQHCQFSWSADNFVKTWQSRRPYVVSPIFYPDDRLGMSYHSIEHALERSRAVVPLSFAEAREITQLTGYSGPFHMIPHGTEERFHWANGENLQPRIYVMCANARGQKGEGIVERVCKRLELPFKYVTGVPHSQLHHVYRQAKVFVHSSPDDRMSLTVGEALCSGCRVISSTRDRGNEWFPGIVECDPEDETLLEVAIAGAWHYPEWDWQPNSRAREMTWDRAARQWLRVYEEALR